MSSQSRHIAVKNRSIASWRLIAGVFVHCLVPAYLILLPLAYMLSPKVDPGSSAVLEHVLTLSWQFLAGYGALAVVTMAVAAALDPVLRWRGARRIAQDPHAAERASNGRLADAVRGGRRMLDQPSRLLLEAIRQRGWAHDDPRFQALSTDVAEVVRTSTAAIASAPPDRRPRLYAMTAESLDHIDRALAALEDERARLDEGDAKVIARYVRLRHVHADSAGEPL